MLTAECPTKTNYDFKGWEDKNGNLIIAYDGENYINAEEGLSQLSFEDLNTNVITLYARFEDHAYKMRFYNKDGSLIGLRNRSSDVSGNYDVDFGYPKFAPLSPLNINEKLFFCKNYTLNIQVIEAKDVPAMDRCGTSDPYLKLYLLGSKPSEKICEVI